MNEAAAIIYDLVDPNANLIFGTVIDPALDDAVSITIIATGFIGGASESEIGALSKASSASHHSTGPVVRQTVPATSSQMHSQHVRLRCLYAYGSSNHGVSIALCLHC